jgi:hypothetical protein
MQTTDSSVPAEIFIVAVRLLAFWAERPAMWFTQAEAQFTLAGISSEKTKFYYVISQLDHRYAMEVEVIITSLPERDPYTTQKTKLVRRLYPLREQHICQLFTLEEMGDGKLSQFRRYFRSFAPGMPDDFFRSIWSNQLPSNVKAMLTGQPEGDLDAADRIIEAAPQPALASVAPLPESNALLQRIKDLSRQVAAFTAELAHLRFSSRAHLCSSSRDPRTSSRNRCSGSRPPLLR